MKKIRMRFARLSVSILSLVVIGTAELGMAQEGDDDSSIDNIMVQELYAAPSQDDLNAMQVKLEAINQLLLKMTCEMHQRANKSTVLKESFAKLEKRYFEVETALKAALREQVGLVLVEPSSSAQSTSLDPQRAQEMYGQLTRACGRLYTEAVQFEQFNSQQSFVLRVKKSRASRLVRFVIEMAESGHILIVS